MMHTISGSALTLMDFSGTRQYIKLYLIACER